MMNEKVKNMNSIEIYNEILSVLDKHDTFIKNEYELDIRYKLKSKIKVQEITNRFGINTISLDFSGTHVRIDDFRMLGLYGEQYNRTISWSDDGRQPENEWLYLISFPTGAYIFGESYPTHTFDKMFDELKTYGPVYSDTRNHNLYFDEKNAKFVDDNFSKILNKYRDLANKELVETKIKKLKAQLELLESKG